MSTENLETNKELEKKENPKTEENQDNINAKETEVEIFDNSELEDVELWESEENTEEQEEQEEQMLQTKEEEAPIIEEHPAITHIKEGRLALDEAYQKASAVFGSEGLLSERIFLAKCWLGNLLGLLGTDNPYKKADLPTKIPPTQQVFDDPIAIKQFKMLNLLDATNVLRDMLEGIAETTIGLSEQKDVVELWESEERTVLWNKMFDVAIKSAYEKIREAKYELGKQLSKQRKSF